jgi:Flp pilus assembly protein TadD
MASRIELFRKAVDRDPGDAVTHFGLGKALFDEKDYAGAAESFHRALAIAPDYTAVYPLLGKSLERMGRNAEAREIYGKGIAVSEKTGDLMPKHEMETRLMKLDWKEKNGGGSA